MNPPLSYALPLDAAPEPAGVPGVVVVILVVLLIGLVVGLVMRARAERRK